MSKLKSILFTGLVGLALSAPIYATSAVYLHALENVQLQASMRSKTEYHGFSRG